MITPSVDEMFTARRNLEAIARRCAGLDGVRAWG